MNYSTEKQDLKSFVLSITLMWVAFLGAMSIFTMVCIFLNKDILNSDQHFIAPNEEYFLLVFGLGMVALSRWFYQKGLQTRVITQPNTAEKMGAYRANFLVSAAMIEGPTLFVTVLFFLTHNQNYLVVIATMILTFAFLLRPSKERFLQEAELNEYDV